MATTWRKLKKSFSSKFSFSFSFRSASNSSSATTTDSAESSTATASRLPRPPPSSASLSSSSSSLGSRLSRSFSLQSSSKTCAICLRSLRRGQGQAIFFAECSHPFHYNCIADNVKHGNLLCPVCRSKWKDVPIQAPANAIDPQRNGMGRTRVSPYNAPPQIQEELEHIEDDEPLPTDSSCPASPSLSQNVTLKCFSEYPAVSASDSPENFGVLVRLRAPPLDDNHGRAPIDLVAVLDVSGSMTSNLSLLKRAVSFIIQNLGSLDRLSIVTFSSIARVVLPLRRMTDNGHEDAINIVNSLSSRGGTNIAAGLMKGVEVLEKRREHNPVASIMLLSDGHDTAGCTAQNRLEYLKVLPASIFPSSNQAEESQQPTIPVHTFGFGIYHDSKALHAISDASGGTFSFIEAISVLQDAFARCIGGLLSVVVQDFKLKVKTVSHGVQIGSILSGRYNSKIFGQGNEAVIDIGNLYAEEEKEFLMYLSIPTTSVENGCESTSLVDISCCHKICVSLSMVQIEAERVEIRRPKILSHTDQTMCLEVDRQRNRLRVAEAIVDAQRMAEKGDLAGAKALLIEQQSTLSSTPSAQAGDSLCNLLETELREISQRMENKEQYERFGRAYVLSGMSSHSWQRATTRGHTTTFTLAPNGGGDTSMSSTTSYETPSMSSMVLKSQVTNLAPGCQPCQLGKSCSLTDGR